LPDTTDPLLLLAAFGAALLAGAGNAVAGGGTNLSFPILIWLGIPPVAANATNGVGLWPGSAAAAWSYKASLARAERRWWWLAVPSVLGGGLGAWLLLSLPPTWFGALAPWLVIVASALVAVEPLLRRWLRSPDHGGASRGWVAAAMTVQFVISVYGGYFGAGIGILLLTSLGLMGMHDLHEANAWKNVLSVAIKGVAVCWFVVAGVLVWPVVLVMTAGSALGGYSTGRFIQRFDQGRLRWVVVVMGVGMGVALLVRGGG
jgi:uncharacterized membrane protein YfcA